MPGRMVDDVSHNATQSADLCPFRALPACKGRRKLSKGCDDGGWVVGVEL